MTASKPYFCPVSATNASIWVTGASGQLGQCLRDVCAAGSDERFVFSGRNDLDLADEAQVENWMHKHKVQLLIHTAAYTAVDRAETETEEAMLANATIPEVLARVCARLSVRMIHISTDYVFSGNRPGDAAGYSESDATGPQGAYGKSKLLGEEAVLHASPQNLAIRTAWFYSEYGHNFVKTMLRLGTERESLRVVNDQHGCPTYAAHLAEALLQMVPALLSKPGEYGGLYHFVNGGATTWYHFASEIMQQAGLNCKVEPCTTADYPTPAKRPAFSMLNTQKIQATFGLRIATWQEALSECLQKLKQT